jgi:hypothetical protein
VALILKADNITFLKVYCRLSITNLKWWSKVISEALGNRPKENCTLINLRNIFKLASTSTTLHSMYSGTHIKTI